MNQHEEDRLRELDLVRRLDKAEDMTRLWKWIAIVICLLTGFVILELRGRLPTPTGFSDPY